MQNLFSDFPATDATAWREKVITELKGRPFDRLLWKWPEGLTLQPYYTLDTVSDFAYVREYDGLFTRPDEQTGSARSWQNCVHIEVNEEETANQQALEALEGGAEGMLFIADDGADLSLSKLLKGIQLPYCTVAFWVKENPASLLKAYQKYAESEEYTIEQLYGYIMYDPIGNLADQGLYDASGLQQLVNVLELADDMPHFRGLAIDFSRFSGTGARPTQQISAGLSLLADYLDQLTDAGIEPKLLFNELCFTIGIGSSYFAEIAKLRVLRMLIHRMAVGYDLKDFQPADVCIHANTSNWTKSILDPNTNMLRSTTEAMSAILGGCNLLTVLPYDNPIKESTPFSRRIARNISNMLRDEAHFDKTNDPVAGTWYIQALMDALYQEGWSRFLAFEEAGGFRMALEKGEIGEQIGKARSFHLDALAKRSVRRVGINAYCNPEEEVPNVSVPSSASDKYSTLPSQRQGQQYEGLRQRTEAFVRENGERPRIALLMFGDAPMRRARAAFTTDFLRAGGFLTEDVTLSKDGNMPDLNAYQLLVLCSSDEDYGKLAPELLQQLRQRYPQPIFIAGNPDQLDEAVKAAKPAGFIHLKTPALPLLTEIQENLFTL